MTINHADFSNKINSRRPHNIEVEESTYDTNIVETQTTTKTRSVHHKRTTIKYSIGDSTNPVEMRTSELDGVTLLSLSSGRGDLFTALESAGFSSPLMKHLAGCEKEQEKEDSSFSGYNFPGTNRPLFMKKDTFKKNVSSASYRESFHKEEMVDTQYLLQGGMETFQLIKGYDSQFFDVLLKGVKKSICRITRLDMCIDFDKDLMFLLSDSVKKGRVHPFGGRLRGYGLLNGIPFDDKPLGKESSFFQEIKGKDSHLILDTLYRGSPRHSPIVLCFYNKSKQSSAVEHQQYLDSTRVEVRIFAKNNHKYDSLTHLLFNSLSTNQGPFIRHCIFTSLLFSNINFSTTQKKKYTLFETFDKWAGWWKTLYQVSVEACATRFDLIDQLEKNLLLSSDSTKNDPQEMINFCAQQLLKIRDQRSHPTFKTAHIESTPLLVSNQTIEGKKKTGRPKGRKDSKVFANRGRPKKSKESQPFFLERNQNM